MNFFSYLAFFSSSICFSLGVFVLILDPRSRVNRYFSLLTFMESLWSFGYIFIFSVPDKGTLWIWYKITAIAWSYAPIVWYYFCMILIDKNYKIKLIPFILIVGFATVFYVQSLVGITFVRDFIITPLGNIEVKNFNSIWIYYYFAMNVPLMTISLYKVYRKMKETNSIRIKKQLSIVFWPHVVHYSLMIIVNIGFNALDLKIPAFGVILNIISLPCIFYAITRFKLMAFDFRTISGQLFDSISDAVFILNVNGEIMQINPVAVELLKTDTSTIIGKQLGDFITEKEGLDSILKKGRTLNGVKNPMEMSFRMGEHDVIPVDGNILPVIDDMKEHVGFFVIAKELNILEAAAKKYNISEREKTVFILLMQGEDVGGIAKKLFISPGTVKNHIHHIYEKTGAKNRIELNRLLFTR